MFLRCNNEYNTLQALVQLFEIRYRCKEVIEEQLLDRDQDSNSRVVDPSSRLWRAAGQLATQPIPVQSHNTDGTSSLVV